MIANGLVMSLIIHLIQLYGGCSDYLMKFIQTLQNKAARVVTRLGWTFHGLLANSLTPPPQYAVLPPPPYLLVSWSRGLLANMLVLPGVLFNYMV